MLSVALVATVVKRNIPTAEALLGIGANPNAFDDNHRSPVHYACRQGDQAMLALLSDHGADLEAQDSARRNGLHTASIFGRLECLEFLLESAVDVNAVDSTGNTGNEDEWLFRSL